MPPDPIDTPDPLAALEESPPGELEPLLGLGTFCTTMGISKAGMAALRRYMLLTHSSPSAYLPYATWQRVWQETLDYREGDV